MKKFENNNYFDYDINYINYTEIGNWLSFHSIIVEEFLLLTTVILLLYGLYNNKKNVLIFEEILNLSCILLIICILLYNTLCYTNIYIFYKSLSISYFATYIKSFGFFITLICLMVSKYYLKQNNINAYEYVILILISLLGFCFLVNSGNFLTVYLAIEIQTLIFYILTTLKKKSGYSTEAGLKYFVIGAIASSFLLLGISYIYGFSGKINFFDLNLLSKLYYFIINEPSILIIDNKDLINHQIFFINFGIVCVIIGLLFKLSAAPFHIWAVDVYEGAPSSITMFFVLVPKIAVFSFLMKLVFHVFIHFWASFENIFLVASTCSMLIGSFGAFQQQTLKRLFIYSSISHIGYMLIGFSSGSALGLQGFFFYIMVYVITNILIWTILISLIKIRTGHHIKHVSDLNGLYSVNPWIAFTLVIGLFSLAGIPPLGGFFAKFLIFIAAIKSGHYFITIIGVFSSLISAYYYLGLIKKIFFKKTEQDNAVIHIKNSLPLLNVVIIMIALTIILFFIIYIDIFLLLSQKFVLHFFL